MTKFGDKTTLKTMETSKYKFITSKKYPIGNDMAKENTDGKEWGYIEID